jgi:hypothetical protein
MTLKILSESRLHPRRGLHCRKAISEGQENCDASAHIHKNQIFQLFLYKPREAVPLSDVHKPFPGIKEFFSEKFWESRAVKMAKEKKPDLHVHTYI